MLCSMVVGRVWAILIEYLEIFCGSFKSRFGISSESRL